MLPRTVRPSSVVFLVFELSDHGVAVHKNTPFLHVPGDHGHETGSVRVEQVGAILLLARKLCGVASVVVSLLLPALSLSPLETRLILVARAGIATG